MVSLLEHYKGAGEANKRVAWASAAIANSHYKSEYTFYFEKFSTTIHEAYTVLNKNGETHSEKHMVRKMLEKMNLLNNAQIEACKQICPSNHGTDFVGVVAYLSE